MTACPPVTFSPHSVFRPGPCLTSGPAPWWDLAHVTAARLGWWILALLVVAAVIYLASWLVRGRRDISRMSRSDRDRWKSARSMDDLGELVIAWMNGEISWTPGHCGPPCEETYPLMPSLEILNRGGFVTDNSQLAETVEDRTWNTWVSGWADDATLARIRAATAGTDLITAACRRTSHECDRMRSVWFCPWHDSVCFWWDCCPAMGAAFNDLWYVNVEDPEPGRNDLLWPVLEKALGSDAGPS